MSTNPAISALAPRFFGDDGDGLLTPKQLSEKLKVTTKTLERWRMTGEGPLYIRLSAKSIRYRVGDVGAFIDRRVLANTSAKI